MPTIDGKVTEIGPSGSLVTDIDADQLAQAPKDETFNVCFGGHETVGLFGNEHDQPDSTMVAKIGEKHCLEIEIVGVSLSDMLGIGVGENVQVSW